MKTNTRNYKQRAFSLFELAIVLLIIAVLFGSTLVIVMTTAEQQRLANTNDSLNKIEEALAIFIAINGRLPCPAAPAQAQDSNSFGIEQKTTAQPTVCDTSTGIFSGTSASGEIQYYGIIPVRTLGLNDSMMFDGWGNRVGYIVQNAFVNNGSNSAGVIVTNPSCISPGSSAQNSGSAQYLCYRGQASGSVSGLGNNLIVRDANLNNISQNAVYVLISHGSNGYGAYNIFGNRNSLPPTSNTLEYDNLNCNPTTFVCSSTGVDTAFIQAPITQNFDDIVRFKTRNNLLIDCNQYAANACNARHGITVQ